MSRANVYATSATSRRNNGLHKNNHTTTDCTVTIYDGLIKLSTTANVPATTANVLTSILHTNTVWTSTSKYFWFTYASGLRTFKCTTKSILSKPIFCQFQSTTIIPNLLSSSTTLTNANTNRTFSNSASSLCNHTSENPRDRINIPSTRFSTFTRHIISRRINRSTDSQGPFYKSTHIDEESKLPIKQALLKCLLEALNVQVHHQFYSNPTGRNSYCRRNVYRSKHKKTTQKTTDSMETKLIRNRTRQNHRSTRRASKNLYYLRCRRLVSSSNAIHPKITTQEASGAPPLMQFGVQGIPAPKERGLMLYNIGDVVDVTYTGQSGYPLRHVQNKLQLKTQRDKSQKQHHTITACSRSIINTLGSY